MGNRKVASSKDGVSPRRKIRGGRPRRRQWKMPDVGTLQHLLQQDLGIEGGIITSDATPVQIAKIQLVNSFLKKYQGREEATAEQVAIQEFLSCNAACQEYVLRPVCDRDDIFLNLLKQELEGLVLGHPWYGLSFTDITRDMGVGPGSSIGSEENDFLTKVFHSPLTSTSLDLYRIYVHGIASKTWAEGEKSRFQSYGVRIVDGNKVTTVPKNVLTRRTIASEPVLNMLIQLGTGNEIRHRMRSLWGIDLSRQQDLNRSLARIGSISGLFSTIDLKSASDMISLNLVKEILPRDLLRACLQSRSPSCSLPGGRVVGLSMVSSMGNGFTFPLQTAIFAATVRATYRLLDIKPSRADAGKEANWGVYGDDIIVLNKAFDLTCRNLALLGFRVNDDKSYSSGPFRESCGGDYYRGYDVRGVYLQKLRTPQHVASLFNRLALWSTKHNVSLDLTMWYLHGFVRNAPRVPLHEGDTSGIKVTQATYLQKAGAYSIPGLQALAYKAWVSRPRSYLVPVERERWKIRTTGGYRDYNPGGCLSAFLGGFIRDGRVSLGYPPSSDPPTLVVTRSTSRWDGWDALGDLRQVEEGWNTLLDRYTNLI